MTEKQFKTIQESLNNFFQMEKGDLFFEPEISNNLEDIQFEAEDSWVVDILLESRVKVAIANYFTSLTLISMDSQYPEVGTLEVNLVLSLKRDYVEPVPRDFKITLKY